LLTGRCPDQPGTQDLKDKPHFARQKRCFRRNTGRESFSAGSDPHYADHGVQDMKEELQVSAEPGGSSCPAGFGVKSGVSVIGLGFLLVLFASVPYLIGAGAMQPLPVTLILAAAGIFLVWAGIFR
jgi:hypothetical protein